MNENGKIAADEPRMPYTNVTHSLTTARNYCTQLVHARIPINTHGLTERVLYPIPDWHRN